MKRTFELVLVEQCAPTLGRGKARQLISVRLRRHCPYPMLRRALGPDAGPPWRSDHDYQGVSRVKRLHDLCLPGLLAGAPFD